jgi:hypothetical protein
MMTCDLVQKEHFHQLTTGVRQLMEFFCPILTVSIPDMTAEGAEKLLYLSAAER